MNLLHLQAAVAAHEDVDVLVLALRAREQLKPHRRDLVEDPARGDRVVLREVGAEFQILRAPRVSLIVLRRLCEKERARPPPELARLFALDKFIFWRVLSFWKSDRDLPPHITTRKTTAPYYYW